MQGNLSAPYARDSAPKIKKEIAALRKAIDAGDDVQPIHIATLGESTARIDIRDEHGNTYTAWPGKVHLLLEREALGQDLDQAHMAVEDLLMSSQSSPRPKLVEIVVQ